MFTHDSMNFDEAKLFGTYEASQSVNYSELGGSSTITTQRAFLVKFLD